MAEPPDFEQLAQRLAQDVGAIHDIGPIAEQLRQVWNSRGVVDRVTIERELSSQMGATAAGPYVKNLDRALRALDASEWKPGANHAPIPHDRDVDIP